MRPNSLLLLSLFLFAPLLAFGDHSRMFPRRVIDDAEEEELLSGMGPQRVNINDAHLKEIAEFAVSEFNKESLKSLVFQRVVSGLSQLVAGDLYTLVIAVRDESLPASPIMNYQCRVNERVWLDDPLELISFHQVFYDTVIYSSD
ncbi:PREDICTED: cystatin-1-like [Fragaria vesca subsp. vesca]|uniref:cystatin-1-like n=1 Tax=Fragaria vesca subsp. vesca TaxID=101020 RepID=UPI0002C2ED65|nr:PREDICTED: cystatin-1-like [Fragaria vesca subsp. vesca]